VYAVVSWGYDATTVYPRGGVAGAWGVQAEAPSAPTRMASDFMRSSFDRTIDASEVGRMGQMMSVPAEEWRAGILSGDGRDRLRK
jgi:hypothetical protein